MYNLPQRTLVKSFVFSTIVTVKQETTRSKLFKAKDLTTILASRESFACQNFLVCNVLCLVMFETEMNEDACSYGGTTHERH